MFKMKNSRTNRKENSLFYFLLNMTGEIPRDLALEKESE